MIIEPRRHLIATNLVFFLLIYILQKCIRIFCIIEAKACPNRSCTPEQRCEDGCDNNTPTPTPPPPASAPKPKPLPVVKRFRFMPSIPLNKTMRNFGYGEGHYQLFVEEKQRRHATKCADSR